jgi:hypothetical protein
VTHDELALDLEPDDKEKQHHEAVVDPVLKRQMEDGVAPGNADLRVREVEVGFRPG